MFHIRLASLFGQIFLIGLLGGLCPACTGSGTSKPDDPRAEMIARTLLEPDIGEQGGTVRFTSQIVHVFIAPEFADAECMTAQGEAVHVVDDVLIWVNREVSLSIEPGASDEDADLAVYRDDTLQPTVLGNGAGDGGGVIEGVLTRATVFAPCNDARVLWEEITQAFGAFGDHGPDDSLWTDANDLQDLRAGKFEKAALRTLYALPPASNKVAVLAEARRQLLRVYRSR